MMMSYLGIIQFLLWVLFYFSISIHRKMFDSNPITNSPSSETHHQFTFIWNSSPIHHHLKLITNSPSSGSHHQFTIIWISSPIHHNLLRDWNLIDRSVISIFWLNSSRFHNLGYNWWFLLKPFKDQILFSIDIWDAT